jgi:sigma-B regulation protein RsbU (phosphoserine phosphatase)
VEVPPGARLFVYSDGAFEISRPDGSMWAFGDFLAALAAPPALPTSPIDALVTTIRGLSQRDDFNDDFSMLELGFG